MNTFLFDKYINGSLSEEEQTELAELLQNEEIQRKFVEYTIEIRSYVSMLKMIKSEPRKKIKKPARTLRLMVLGAAAVITVFLYLNLAKFRSFSLDGKFVNLNEKIYAETETQLSSFDGSKLILSPDSEIEILSYEPVELVLHKGEVKAQIQPQKKSLKIRVGDTITEVMGTGFTLQKNGEEVDLYVDEGKVSFGTKEEKLFFTAGEAGRVDENGLVRIDSKYKQWYDWSRKYARNKDVLVYLNFADNESLNNIASATNKSINFEKRYGEFTGGRWAEKLAIKNGGLESLNNEHFGVTQNFTVWSWVKLNKELKDYPPILNAENLQWRLQFSLRGEFIHAGHRTEVVDGQVNMEKDQWQFLALTFTAGEVRCYVNGKLDGIMPGEPFNVVPDSIKIGYYKQSNLFRIFNGLIDELAIQKQALSASEIKEIYEITKPQSE